MPQFSKRSAQRLAECHHDLQAVMNKAIETVDFTILCGHRGKEEQNKAVAEGKSKTPWPRSKHNATPSLAVDIAPYPIDWNDMARFKALAEHIHETAYSLGIVLRHGADWNMNGDTTDEKFTDWPHWEIINGHR